VQRTERKAKTGTFKVRGSILTVGSRFRNGHSTDGLVDRLPGLLRQMLVGRMSETRPPPLAGLTVIDLGQVYQDPTPAPPGQGRGQLIKVEPPRGEPLRAREAVGGGASLPLAMLNSNKRAITLNLKTAPWHRAAPSAGAEGRRSAGELRAGGDEPARRRA